MKQITLKVEDNKYSFFMELLKNFDFIQLQEENCDSKEEITLNLKQAFKDLKQYREGKLKTTSAKEFLDEL